VLFFAILIVPGLDYRFHWSQLPAAIVVLGDMLLVLSFAMIFFVFRENSYAASTIKVEAAQRVISTGPYRLVRHPMYSAALILFLATPLALGSAWGLSVAIPLVAVLIAHLTGEERYLSAHLPGYDAYRQQVSYRLVAIGLVAAVRNAGRVGVRHINGQSSRHLILKVTPIGDDYGCHRSNGDLQCGSLLEARSGAAGLDRACDLRRHSCIESGQQPGMGLHRCTQP
jgi:protein-S-isoprenylcysteine O-methyltransferase Ste14